MHYCTNMLITDSDNGLWPSWRQVITWTSDDWLSIGSLGLHFNGILFQIQPVSVKKTALQIVVPKMSILLRLQSCNSSGPSNSIWRRRSWSTLTKVTAFCLTALSHYPNQCWLIINVVRGIHMRTICPKLLMKSICKLSLKITLLKLQPHLAWAS